MFIFKICVWIKSGNIFLAHPVKKRHLSLSRSKIDVWAAMWGVSGRVVAPNYVKIYVKHLLI